jgi:hypothetical protein
MGKGALEFFSVMHAADGKMQDAFITGSGILWVIAILGCLKPRKGSFDLAIEHILLLIGFQRWTGLKTSWSRAQGLQTSGAVTPLRP